MSSKPIQNQKKAKNKEFITQIQSVGKRTGIAQKPIDEAIPTYEKGMCEQIQRGDNNSFIVLGRDRPSNLYSGYGGKGSTQCGRIDLLVGLGAGMKGGPPNEDVIVNPNFALDAARIYISQKTDIDKNFGLSRGRQGNKKGHSGIGIKADAVRVIGRGGVKIITGKGQNIKAGMGGEKLSMGSKESRPSPKIELIAGNQDGSSRHFSIDKGFFSVNNIQPAVMGDNMVDAVGELIELVNQLQGAVANFATQQTLLNTVMTVHTHPVALAYTTPSPELMGAGINNTIKMITDVHIPLFSQKVNTMFYEMNYLQPFGMQYICSRSVNIT